MKNPTEEQIRTYAYELYVKSGCKPGRELKNWLDAERELKQMPERDDAEAIWERKLTKRSGDGKAVAVGSGRDQGFKKGF